YRPWQRKPSLASSMPWTPSRTSRLASTIATEIIFSRVYSNCQGQHKLDGVASCSALPLSCSQINSESRARRPDCMNRPFLKVNALIYYTNAQIYPGPVYYISG